MDYENVIIDSIEILAALMFIHESSWALCDEAIVELILIEKDFLSPQLSLMTDH